MDDLPNKLEEAELGLTLHWPWATAIVDGPKRIENRTWEPWDSVIGEHIAIHCGKTENIDAAANIALDERIDWHPDDDGRAFDEVAGCIVGVARVVGWWKPPDGRFCDPDLDAPAVLGPGEIDWHGCGDPDNSTWWIGPIGWLLGEVETIAPIPARGRPGLWGVREQIAAAQGQEPAPESDDPDDEPEPEPDPDPQRTLFGTANTEEVTRANT